MSYRNVMPLFVAYFVPPFSLKRNPFGTFGILVLSTYHSGCEISAEAGLLYLSVRDICSVKGGKVGVEHAVRTIPGVLNAVCVAVADSVTRLIRPSFGTCQNPLTSQT